MIDELRIYLNSSIYYRRIEGGYFIFMLYERHNYLNKNIEYLISNEIIEYDIRSAGFNLTKKFKLLDDNKINYLEKLDKHQRHVQLGLYQREDIKFKKELNEKFIEIRKWFFKNNDLVDEEILSIKRDAIITLRRCSNTQLDNVEFIEKNIYTSYYYLNNYEFYYNKDVIHVKGIDDEKLKLHKEYMLDFLNNFFMMNEISPHKKIIELLKDFSYYYKLKKLNIEYYRELNDQSLFRLKEKYKLFNNKLGIRDIGDINDIEIDYN
jgi:hypothetical protein